MGEVGGEEGAGLGEGCEEVAVLEGKKWGLVGFWGGGREVEGGRVTLGLGGKGRRRWGISW